MLKVQIKLPVLPVLRCSHVKSLFFWDRGKCVNVSERRPLVADISGAGTREPKFRRDVGVVLPGKSRAEDVVACFPVTGAQLVVQLSWLTLVRSNHVAVNAQLCRLAPVSLL